MSENEGRLEEDAARDRPRYRLLLDITDHIARAPNVGEAFRQCALPLLDLTEGELLNLSLYDPTRDCMLNRYWKRNRESGEFTSFPVDKAASGWAWRHQKQVAIADIEREQRFTGCVPALRNHGVRSFTALPVSMPARRFGALGVGRSVPEALSAENLEFLVGVALMAAFALEKERADRASEEQQSPLAISRELSSKPELDKLLPAILSSLRGIARYSHTVLSLLEEDGTHLRICGDILEWESPVDHDAIVPVEHTLSAQAIRTHRVATFSAIEIGAMHDPLAKVMLARGVQSACVVPLIAGNRVWGSLNTSSTTENSVGSSGIEYLQQVAHHIAAALHNAHAQRQIANLSDCLAREKRHFEIETRGEPHLDQIVGNSAALKRVLDFAAIVADTDSTVMITGETGTGKERIARVIHSMSRRQDRNFIKLNCAAIPTGLLESELFGHEKGAFTGAVSQKVGHLELADKGTLFLDEVGEIPLELQPKLLRVLQDQEFERLGSTRTIHIDVRLIAATNRDLLRHVGEKQFRNDLYYRLHVFPLHLPPLRERREDIPLLVRYFVEKSAQRLNKRIDFIPDEAIGVMLRWQWPGNIRELENFIERSVILSEGNVLRPPLSELRRESYQAADEEGTLRQKERDHIIEVLRRTRGVLSGPAGAAKRLGLKRTTLQSKLRKLGISRMDYLD